MNTKKTLTALALGAAILGAGYYTYSGLKRNLDEIKPVKEQTKYASSIAVPGAPAPDFSATSLDGKIIQLSKLENKPVLLNFCAPWCAPCRELAPYVRELYNKQKDSGLEVIYIASRSTKPEDLTALLNKHDPYTFVHDKDKVIGTMYGIDAIPSLVLIKDGRIVSSRLGASDCFEWIQKLKVDLKSK